MSDTSLEAANEALASMRATLARLTVIRDKVEAETQELRRETAERGDEQSNDRRTGVNGRDWQILQQRIDLSKTTMRDIIGGVDKSPEALSVRGEISGRMARMRDFFSSNLDQEALDAAADAQARLTAAVERTNATLGRLGPR